MRKLFSSGGLSGMGWTERLVVIMVIASLVAVLGGCSATSLRCSTDGDSSYVELYNIPTNVSQNIRAYTEVCAFAYERDQVKLNIVDHE